MLTGRGDALVHTLLAAPRGEPSDDARLLGAFVATHDEAAFAQLVRRHGPLVMGVCRRVLGDRTDAEDAFQAAFLVLARKARSVEAGEKLAGWLYTTAYRVALRARGRRARRAEREQPVNPLPPVPVAPPDAAPDELLAELDREIGLLPEAYRLAVVMCELQGRSRAEAAHAMGIPEGTLSSRLAAARKLLARRLGGLLSAAGVAGVLSAATARASVPARLVTATAQAAAPFAAGHPILATNLSPSAVSLAEGVLRLMFAAKLKLAVALLVVPLFAGFALSLGDGGPAPAPAPRDANLPILAPGEFAVQAKTADEKKEPATKTEPAKKEPAPIENLKARLKKLDDEAMKIREAMLKEIDDEGKRLDDVVAKAKKDYEDASRKNDRDAIVKASQALTAARSEKMKIQSLRYGVERRLQLPDPPPPPLPPDERLGLRLSPPGTILADQLGLEKNQGLVVESVKADSPGAKLGFQPSDVLLKVDGKPVTHSTSEFRKLLNGLKPDAEVEAVVVRKGKPETVKGFKVPAPTPRG